MKECPHCGKDTEKAPPRDIISELSDAACKRVVSRGTSFTPTVAYLGAEELRLAWEETNLRAQPMAATFEGFKLVVLRGEVTIYVQTGPLRLVSVELKNHLAVGGEKA